MKGIWAIGLGVIAAANFYLQAADQDVQKQIEALRAEFNKELNAVKSDSQRQIDALKKENQQLQQKSGLPPVGPGMASQAIERKYGPNANVTTNAGKLSIGGLVHVWYYTIMNDNRGLFDKAGPASIPDTNEAQDNDSFRLRRTELMFTMDIHENITAVVLIDPTGEIGGFPLITDNQGGRKRINQVAPGVAFAGSTGSISAAQSGAGASARLLEDAFINYHGVIPHHDITIGQFKPQIGEESIRSSSQLDFVERSLIGLQNDTWDLGANIHGSWWDGRFQYTLAVFDGAGNYHGSAGASYNRPDDNDEKDFSYRVLVRPLWKNETWGSLELGMSSKFGKHGEAGGVDAGNFPVNGLNRMRTWGFFHDAWASYMPGGPVKGWWLRGEWGRIKDANAPGAVLDDSGNGTLSGGFAQGNGHPFSTQGWYFAIGYKVSDSVFKDSAPGWIKNFEFTFRYDTFGNVEVADLNKPEHTDVFKTSVFTGGINYYIKGQNAKIQVNYNAVRDPDGGNHNFHRVHNDSLVWNFQVAF